MLISTLIKKANKVLNLGKPETPPAGETRPVRISGNIPQVLVHRIFVTTPPLVIFLCSDDHIFFLENIKPRCVLISIYQINPGNKRFLSEFAAPITLEGWQLHLEKAYHSWKTPTEKHLEDNFQQNKMVVLNHK